MKKSLTLLCATLLLAACGGGGGDDADTDPNPTTTPAAPVAASAEGWWRGSAANNAQVALVILENGETWGLYTDSSGAIVGAIYGTTTTSGNTLAGSGREFNIASRTISLASYSGNFTPRTSLTVSGATSNGVYESAYETAASLNMIAGGFSGQGVTGTSPVQPVSITVSSTGQFTAPASLGCSAAGSVAPRASGKNIFDVSVTFTGANCALGDGALATGIAIYDTGSQKAVVLVMNSDKSDGFIFVGAKNP